MLRTFQMPLLQSMLDYENHLHSRDMSNHTFTEIHKINLESFVVICCNSMICMMPLDMHVNQKPEVNIRDPPIFILAHRIWSHGHLSSSTYHLSSLASCASVIIGGYMVSSQALRKIFGA